MEEAKFRVEQNIIKQKKIELSHLSRVKQCNELWGRLH